MTTRTISVTELKQNLGEMIRRAAYSGERIILLSHGKERAALISIEDLHLLERLGPEALALYEQQQEQLLADAAQLRDAAAADGYQADSMAELTELREERLDELTNLR